MPLRATLLTPERVTAQYPRILDVMQLIELLHGMGVGSNSSPNTQLLLCAKEIDF